MSNCSKENFTKLPDTVSFDALFSAIKNSPNVIVDIFNSLGYEVVKEDYIYIVEEPIYKTVAVSKTRQVPCGFPCFYRTETYTDYEEKFNGYKKVEKTSQRYILRKKSQ